MDPTTCLFEILTLCARPAVTHDERVEITDKLSALRSWLNRGGFVPVVGREGSQFTVGRRS